MSLLMLKYDLHRRNSLMLLFIAALISVLYFVFVLTIVNRLEQTMLSTLVGHEIDELVSELAEDPHLAMPKTASVHAYLMSQAHENPIPEFLKKLESNLHHEVTIDDKTFHVAIVDLNNDRLYLAFDVTEIIKYRAFLIFTMVGGGVLALVFLLMGGIWISKRFLLPVSELAYEVASFNPNDRNIRIGKKYSDFEVGLIANSFDQFMDKMDDFVDREQAFTAAISHELRTPVSVVATSIDLLELSGVSEQQKGAVNRIKVSTNYMSKVIESLLFFAREYDSSPDLTLPENDIVRVCEDVMDQYLTLAKDKNLTLRLITESATRVRISDNHIEIILGNLVRNAINNTDNGEITITVLKDGFSVTDTGRGMSADTIKRILQGAKIHSQNHVSGMGLYLVTNICEYYHLKLDIDSTLDKGSRFLIRFPASLLGGYSG